MDEQLLRSPIIYIPIGYPGSGKTFFSRQYSGSAMIPLIDTERIRRELFENPEYNNDEDKIVLAMADYMAEQFLQSGQSIIFDGLNSTRVRRRILKEMAKRFHSEFLVIWVQTDLDTSRDRARNRDRRNPDDKYARSFSNQEFKDYVAKLKLPQREEYVVISGKHVYKNQLHSVQRKLQLLAQPKIKPQVITHPTFPGRVDINRRSNTRR